MDQTVMDYLQQFAEDARDNINDPGDLTGRLVLMVAMLVIWSVLRRLMTKLWYLVFRHNKRAANRLIAVTRYLMGAVVLVATVRIWLSADDSVLILLILVGGLVFLSGKELFTNVVGWILILTHHPFRIGDRIEMKGMIGQVLRLNWQTFTLIELGTWFDSEAPTGRVLKIPNHLILDETIKNYSDSSHFVWKEIGFRFTYTSDWETAYNIIEQVTKRYATEFGESLNFEEEREMEMQQLTTGGEVKNTMIVDASENGIGIKVRFPVRYEKTTTTKTFLQKQILSAFKQHPGIEPIGEYYHIVPTNPDVFEG